MQTQKKYYIIQVVYSSMGPAPALDPRCGGAASSSHTLSLSLASQSDSTEELMGQQGCIQKLGG